MDGVWTESGRSLDGVWTESHGVGAEADNVDRCREVESESGTVV